MSRHLFVDISSHGLGHLAQAAPVLAALRQRLPDLRLTIRSGLPEARIRARLGGKFEATEACSDFGFEMHDAISIDLPRTAGRYRAFHTDWVGRVDEEARFLQKLAPDLVLTDVAYLPLAGAARAGIPALSMCSLNWADLFAHFFGHEPWAAPIHKEILAAYRSARSFLRLTPSMPMTDLANAQAVLPVAAIGKDRRPELKSKLACADRDKIVLVAYGGFDRDLKAERWPITAGIHWLIPANWNIRRADMSAFEPLGMPFSDLLSSVDAILTKPGYGTFVEAASASTRVLYQRREDWPEQEYLIAWLKDNACCREVSAHEIATGEFSQALDRLFQAPARRPPLPGGAEQAAGLIADTLLAPAC